VEEAFAPEIEFAVHEGGGGAEGVVEMVDGQRGVFAVVAEDDSRAVAGSDINAGGSADGGRKDEIGDTVEADRIAKRLASHGVQAREHVLIVPEKVQRVVVEEW